MRSRNRRSHPQLLRSLLRPLHLLPRHLVHPRQSGRRSSAQHLALLKDRLWTILPRSLLENVNFGNVDMLYILVRLTVFDLLGCRLSRSRFSCCSLTSKHRAGSNRVL